MKKKKVLKQQVQRVLEIILTTMIIITVSVNDFTVSLKSLVIIAIWAVIMIVIGYLLEQYSR